MQTWLVVAAVAVLIAASSYILAFAWRLWNVQRLHTRARGHLVLTFDDGPGPRMTAGIRDLLRREGVHATFFLTGFRADRYPEVVRQTASEGHELASHSQQHLNAWRHPLKSMADTRTGLQSTRRLSPSARFFRPPYGKATIWTHLVCRLEGFRVAYWTIDCKDAESHTIRQVEDVTKELLDKGGGVVLMHDLDMDPAEFPDREVQVLDLCRSLIKCARAHGLRIAPLGDLYSSSEPTRS